MYLGRGVSPVIVLPAMFVLSQTFSPGICDEPGVCPELRLPPVGVQRGFISVLLLYRLLLGKDPNPSA